MQGVSFFQTSLTGKMVYTVVYTGMSFSNFEKKNSFYDAAQKKISK